LDEPAQISEIELQWVGQKGAMTLEKVTIVSDEERHAIPINVLSEASTNWRFASEASEAMVYENTQVLPRAWLVSEAVALKPEEILKAIKTSSLPDGRTYDPKQMVLVEEHQPHVPAHPNASAYAHIGHMTDMVMEVRTSSASDAFLVTSDTWYPGWQATVDGAPASIFRANYALRGVRIPAGRHLIRFEYRPKMFYLGTAISVISVLALAGILAVPFVKSKGAKFTVDTR